MVRRWSSAVALVAAAACAGCGGGEARSASSGAAVERVGKSSAGSVVQFADCGDWRAATEAERYATVRALRGQLTPQRSQTAASPLPDQRAYAMLQRTCSSSNVESLRLYQLYARMQAFAPLME